MTTPLIIDTDPGIDDAVAILLALSSPELDVRAVTTVAGNTTIESTTRNAARILALAGRRDIPIGRGATGPLVRRASPPISEVHGLDGLGDAGIAESDLVADPRGALRLVSEVVRASAEPITLVALGPLTNVALLDAICPDILRRLDRIVVMGGAARGGNVTPTAEFNMWFDPEAAARVFAADLDPLMVGLDVTERAITHADRWQPLEQGGTASAAVLAMNRFYAAYHQQVHGGEPSTVQHDSLAMATTIAPDLVRAVPAHVEVDHSSPLTAGTTVVDLHERSGLPANARVALEVDAERFNDLLVSRISGYLNRLP